jgi:FAD/FMN-containing dehydrogenase
MNRTPNAPSVVDLPASRPSEGRTSKTKGPAVASTSAQAQNISLDDLQGRLEGELITPDDPSYDDARQVVFKGVDKRPLAVVQAAGADDVAAVVNAAREGGLELAVRSGGHSRPGYGTVDGGLVIDLSRMDGVEMDADDGTAWVEAGATASKYTLATAEKGRTTGLGDTGSVGVGGITLAGGIGFLVRKTGLTIDNLLAAEVVTADGEVVQASEDSEPDLFWAIRGGEGNFGVATRFQLRLAEISEIVGGILILPASPQVITGFLEAAQAAPVELSTIANVTIAPPMPFLPEAAHGKPVLIGLFAYVGPVDQAEEVIAPFRALAEPLADMVRPMRYPELFEAPEQEARFASGTNFFADSLDPAAAEAILEQLPKSTAPMTAVQLRVLGGALARIPNDATAFAHRDKGLFVNVATMYMDAGEKEAHDAWVDGLANLLGKDGAGGYVGFLGDEGEATIRAAYPGATWDRLRELKRRYDPDNLFHLNHNIPPAVG